MPLRISLSGGHGLFTAGKRCLKSLDPKETREWWLNQRIINYIESGLKDYKDVTILRVDDRTGKIDIPLRERAKNINAFKPDIHISTHHDAGIKGGSGGGLTVYRTPNSSSASVKYQKALYNALIKHTGLKGNRSNGTPTANFYIIRNVKAPALLIEHGYMDSKVDVPIILSDKFARNCANAYIEFLVAEFKLVRKSDASNVKPSLPSKPSSRAIQKGDKGANVKKLQADLNSLGIKVEVDGIFGNATELAVRTFQNKYKLQVDGYVGNETTSKINSLLAEKSKPTKELYRVRKSWNDPKSQKNAYHVLDSAKEEADKYGYNVYDSKGTLVYPIDKPIIPEPVNPTPKPPTVAPVPPKEDKDTVAIMGESKASVSQMTAMLLRNNPKPKIEISAEEFCRIFLEEGKAENVRGDIAFLQAMKETGWLSYGGQVLPEQNNYAGIGATNNSPIGKGNWFATVRLGVRAQIQHLKAYASKDDLVNLNVDPRFKYVTRGIAPNWTDLNGKWAVPGTNYGQDILKMYEDLLKVTVEERDYEVEIETFKKEITELKIEIKELNDKLKRIKAFIEKV